MSLVRGLLPKCRNTNAVAVILALSSLLVSLLGIRQSLQLSSHHHHHRSTMLPNRQTEASSVSATAAENDEMATMRQNNTTQKFLDGMKPWEVIDPAHVDATTRQPAARKSIDDTVPSNVASHAEAKTKPAAFRGHARDQQRAVVEIPAADLFPQRRRHPKDRSADYDDITLASGVDLHGDSSTTTVMGMATGYELPTYQIFVGSLRHTGFAGHIILGLERNASSDVVHYLQSQNVAIQWMDLTNCAEGKERQPATSRRLRYELHNNNNSTTKPPPPQCVTAYPDLKPRWSRFPIAADWLRDCPTCTGPVLLMDVRDSFFQRDPFGPGSPTIEGLHVFEEAYPAQTTSNHWITSWPLAQCKGVAFTQPMLCSGTTVGTRRAMLQYLQIMHQEMKNWTQTEHCQFPFAGDDQSIHNYLYYMGYLPFAKAIPNRSGGIVNTVGKIGAKIRGDNVERVLRQRPEMKKAGAVREPLEGANNHTWIGPQFNMTDSDGHFIEYDGSLSRVIHQWDRFGPTLFTWLKKSFVTNSSTAPG